MGIGKPAGAGKTEPVSLDTATTHILEECRMVLPGIQALFGFQMVAVFNASFETKLQPHERWLHLAAILFVTVAIALVMAPAALHRHTQQREVSERFVWLSSRLVLAGMRALLAGLCCDVFLVARIIVGSASFAASVTVLLLAVFVALWIVLPRRERSKRI